MCNLTSQTELHLICCICSVSIHFTAPSMALHSHKFTSYNSSFLPVPCIWSMPSLHMIKMLYGIPNANVFWHVHFANCLVHHPLPFFFSLPCRQLWLRQGGRLGYFRVRRTHENPKKKNQIREQASKAPHVHTQSPMLLQMHVLYLNLLSVVGTRILQQYRYKAACFFAIAIEQKPLRVPTGSILNASATFPCSNIC